MTETDEYFPRGKVAPGVKKAQAAGGGEPVSRGERSVKRKSSREADSLFKNFDEKPREKRKAKKSKNALTPEEEKAISGKRRSQDEKRFAVVPLSYDQIVEGMLSLGIITKILDHEICVNLPGRTSGYVSITDISTPYIKMLESHTADGETETDEETPIYTLKEMFSIGQCVVVKVKSIQRTTPKLKVILSMNPQDIYSNYNTTILKEDIVMIAAVSSVEDHGYQMDVGINGARCFLSKEDVKRNVQASNLKRPLGVGQLLHCKINKIQFHRLIANIQFTTNVKAIRSQKMDDIIGLNYSTLIPGMLVDAVVMETHKTGIMAYCLDLNGLVHQDHMENEWTGPESLEIGSSVAARVLYILPNLTTPYLTLQTSMVPMTMQQHKSDKSKILGTKQKVRVVRVEKRGISVRIEEDGSKGIIPIPHIGDPSLLTVEDISKKYKDGSVHECRVIQRSMIERVYLCSLRKDKMENDFVHSEQALPGKTTSCKILRWNNGGAIVQFGSGLNGFIPNQLFRSEKLSDKAKEKLIGTVHKGLIMSRDAEKDKLVLTVRKELVKSNGATICSLGEAETGMVGLAVIKFCTKGAVFVTTVGGVDGFIPASKLSKVRLDDIREVFRCGQVLQYKVLEVMHERRQILMTAILDEDGDSNDESGEGSQVDKNKSRKRSADSAADDAAPTEVKRKKKRKQKKKKDMQEVMKTIKEDSDDDDEFADLNGTAETSLNLPDTENFWDSSAAVMEESDSEPDESLEDRPKKLRKLDTKPAAHDAEAMPVVNDAATAAADCAELAVKYESGVISSPDDPFFWIKLMTHYISVGSIEKARGVAKQALTTINYRNEKAKLRVWGAMFNLEIKYGTEETLKTVYTDALQRADQFECLKVMSLVYDKADRIKDAERIYRQMVKQFRLEPVAWIRFGTFYFQRHKTDCGRELLNEALTIIPATKQVLLITKFALLELHHGEKGRGESMMDRVLTQYPHRCDMWLLFANALIKLGDFDGARSVFRKAFEVSWNPRKVKPLLKRFQEFESSHGDEETRAEFQSLALKALNVSANNN